MNLLDLVVSLHRIGAVLRRDGDKLYLQKPPGVEIQASWIDRLRTERDEVRAILDGFAARADAVAATALDTARQCYALSISQGRWFKAHAGGQSRRSLIMQNVLRIDEAVNADVIAGALDALVSKHEIFRTAYDETDGVPAQTILPPRPTRLDLSVPGPDETEEAAVHRVQETLLAQDYDLGSGEVVRCALLKVGERRHYLFVDIHHIAADGRSMHMLMEEFGQAYAALRDSQPVDLGKARARYVDFAEFERRALASPDLADYWKRAVVADYGYNEIPVAGDYRNPDLRSHRIDLVIDAAQSAQIRQALAQLGTSKAALLLATLALTLSGRLVRADGNAVRGVNFGVPVAGHPTEQWHGVIGCLANMTVLSVPLPDLDTRYALFVASIAQRIAANIERRYLPFPWLLRLLETPADNRVFQVAFNMITRPPARSDAPRVDMHPHAVAGRERVCMFDFALFVDDRRDSATLSFEYRRSQLTDADARHLVHVYAQTLRESLRLVAGKPRLADVLRAVGDTRVKATADP